MRFTVHSLKSLKPSKKMLLSLNDAIPSERERLRRLIELCHLQLFIWPGYPSLYRPLCELFHLHRYRTDGLFAEPNDRRKRDLLQKNQWKAMRPSMASHQSSGTSKGSAFSTQSGHAWSRPLPRGPEIRSTATDKAGLSNLGSTCYMNSVLQALFLSDDFRLKLMASKSLKYHKDGDGGNGKMAESEWTRLQRMVQSLQSVFGHLQCTKRRAVSTRKFVDLLPAPWTGGRQQ